MSKRAAVEEVPQDGARKKSSKEVVASLAKVIEHGTHLSAISTSASSAGTRSPTAMSVGSTTPSPPRSGGGEKDDGGDEKEPPPAQPDPDEEATQRFPADEKDPETRTAERSPPAGVASKTDAR